ncbi:MAG: GAF domain-containing protein [Cyanobacteria bacterium J06642_11]
MSLASEQFSQSLGVSVFLDGYSSHSALAHALLELSQCEAIYSGDLKTATATIVHAVVKNLATSSCQIWLYSRDRSHVQRIADYSSPSRHQAAVDITVAHHFDYFQQLTQRQWLVVDTRSQQSTGDKYILPQQQLPPYLQSETAVTAFLEVPIYHQDQIVGLICCDQYHSPRVWQASEKSFMLTTACLMALTLSQSQQQQQTQRLNKQNHSHRGYWY